MKVGDYCRIKVTNVGLFRPLSRIGRIVEITDGGKVYAKFWFDNLVGWTVEVLASDQVKVVKKPKGYFIPLD